MKNKLFTWEELLLYFPEWREDEYVRDSYLKNKFKNSPKFLENEIYSNFGNNYGIRIFLNSNLKSISLEWIREKGIQKSLKEYHQNLSKEVYKEVLNDLNKSYETLESWRGFIKSSKFPDRELWNVIYLKKDFLGVFMRDCYNVSRLPPDNLAPTTIILEEGEPIGLVENIKQGGCRNGNYIRGKNLSDCIRNADEIYRFFRDKGFRNV